MKKIIFYLLCASVLSANSLLEVCIMKKEEQGKIDTKINKALKSISIANMKNKSNYKALKECINAYSEGEKFINTVPHPCQGNRLPWQSRPYGEGIRMVVFDPYIADACYKKAKCKQLDGEYSNHWDCNGREFYMDEEITNN